MQLKIRKRNKNFEMFNPVKFQNFLDIITENKKEYSEKLKDILQTFKPNEVVESSELIKRVENFAVARISEITPFWDTVARNAVLSEIYNKYKDQLKAINTKSKGFGHINLEYDKLFTYQGIQNFYTKYCFDESPQEAYRRVANKLKVPELYTILATHSATLATPIMANSKSKNFQAASCILLEPDDSSDAILERVRHAAIYSKLKGGIAVNFSNLRNNCIPFIRIFESTIRAWDQGKLRVGACCAYLDWFHINIKDFIQLKSNGGTPETRIRGLKYSVILDNFFIEAVENNQDVYLIDPIIYEIQAFKSKTSREKYHEAIKFILSKDQEFEFKDFKIKVKDIIVKISARELAANIFKERFETGNIYLVHYENINEQGLLTREVKFSNLCTEIVEPVDSSMNEIALCNLASINLKKYYKMQNSDRYNLVKTLVKAMDNVLDIQDYPFEEAKNSNLQNRYLGIGCFGLHHLLASQNIQMDSQKSLEFQDKLFFNLSMDIFEASAELAKERGAPPGFKNTKMFGCGTLPFDLARKEAIELTQFSKNLKADLEEPEPKLEESKRFLKVKAKIQKYGLRNCCLLAIAPTASSSKSIDTTASIDPVTNISGFTEGKILTPYITPDFKEFRDFYTSAFEMDQEMLIKANAVRQKWIDQAQSLTLFLKGHRQSLKDFIKMHFMGFKYGVKTFYYIKQTKEETLECQSCS